MTGGTPSTRDGANYLNGGIPWIVSGDIHLGEIFEVSNRITQKGMDGSPAKFLPENSVLIALNGQGKTRATVALLRISGATCNQSIVAINPKSTATLDHRYLFVTLRSMYQQLRNLTGHKSRAGLNMRLIGQVGIPLPPLAEQKRIAGILDAADALRTRRRESLAQLDTLLQSTFLDMFGDTGTTVTIGEMLSDGSLERHKDGNHGSLYPRAHEFGESGVPFLSAKCISEQGDLLLPEVKFLNAKKARRLRLGWIKEGDVLLAHNASVGKTFLYHGEFDEALIGTSLTAFRPNPEVLDSAYLLGALRSHIFQQQLFANMGQTTRNQVPITSQRRLSISLPPLDLQHRFAAIVESVEQQKARQRTHLAELDTLFASLQSRAFRGDL